MPWINKHLNISYAVCLVIAFIIGTTVFFTGNTAVHVIGTVISAVLMIGGSVWILLKKGQSMWYLLLMIIFSLALFVLALALPNKRAGQGETPKINDADYYKQREAGAQ